ncbi:MAG TPA: rod shape-determining protein RodA [Gemmatimonadaceae bacterium]|nr:rod shape-determining protein RodA [Gemmatimonadaceae bacterium]
MKTLRSVVIDSRLITVAVALSLFGLAMVYSAGQTDIKTGAASAYKSQSLWLLIGLAATYGLLKMPVRFIKWVTWPAYVFTLVLLLSLLVLGVGSGANGHTRSWLAIGGHRLGQPAEFAKLTVVLMLAKVLSESRLDSKSLLDLWKPALAVGIPWLLIMLQPDLGSSIVFIGIFFGMLYWSGVEWPLLLLLLSPAISLLLSFSVGLWGAWFFILLALVLWYRPFLIEGIFLMVLNVATGVVAPIMWEKLAPYQQNRLKVFIDPSADPRQSGYHVLQSRIAIGSGGLFGNGFTMGTQKRSGFLPEQHTDFIFAVVGEELGFIGVTIALTLFLALLLRATGIAARANDSFSSLVAFGLMSSWLVHVAVNIGMTLNLMPIVGIPLPFFSYGGSMMLASWLSVAVLLRISGEGRGQSNI